VTHTVDFSQSLKRAAFGLAKQLGVDAVLRQINDARLLVIMYHGVTASPEYPQVWTQLGEERFKAHLEFLRDHYVFISLSDLERAIRTGNSLPHRSALITFDDGLRNNYSVAFPILRHMGIPAVIFLTVDLIGTDQVLWVDELYWMLIYAMHFPPCLGGEAAQRYFQAGRKWETYQIIVEQLKTSGVVHRKQVMDELRHSISLSDRHWLTDFGFLSWDQVRTMKRSGIIDFGVHTSTHQILIDLQPEEWECEMSHPKTKIEKEIGSKVFSFCFPNGRPGLDFKQEHIDFLAKSGYMCAFTTEARLFDLSRDSPFQIGRIPAGNDFTSEMGYFRLSTSGALQGFRTII
jgi:peptidoglycan/xylan/chitin deacetylase (PgdA/CDA1 family)